MFASTSMTTVTVASPNQTLRRHTDQVRGVVHLPAGQQYITCSLDGSVKLWDPEKGACTWQDSAVYDTEVWSMALSPNGKTVVSGGNKGILRLWNVKRGKVFSRWAGHDHVVGALCWSGNGKQVLSGSWDGTARVWNVKTGKTVLTIETGHKHVFAVIFSPDATKIATGGFDENAVKIWDAKTGELVDTLKHLIQVWSLAWTSDGKKLFSGSCGSIGIFDTTTWQQIAALEGHTHLVYAITLSQDQRFLISASADNTARLWNLDTNLPLGPPLQHKDFVRCAALSADGTVLVTGCQDTKVYIWDIHAILEELLSIGTNNASKDILEQKVPQRDLGIERTPRSSLSDKSFLQADATRDLDEFGGVDELSPRFFDGMEASDSSPAGGALPHSSASALLARLFSLFHRFRPDNVEATKPLQSSTPSVFHPRVLFARLSSLIHRSPPENDASSKLQQPPTHSRLEPHALLARLSSLLPHLPLNTDEEAVPHPTTPSGLRLDALIDRLSSFFRSQPHTHEEIELSRYLECPHVVEVAAVRDREVIFTAPPPPQNTQQQTQSHGQGSSTTPPAPGTNPTTPPRHPYSLPVRLLAHLVLLLCCASPQHANGNVQPTQQKVQLQDQAHAQAPSQTQPAALSTSAIHTTIVTHAASPVAANV